MQPTTALCYSAACSKAKRKASALAAKKEAELTAMDEQLEGLEYTSKDLAGLTVKHTKEDIQEGQQMILTLADSGVLDGEDDVLENVNLNDSDRTKESLEAKKGITEYRGYDDDEFDQFGKVGMNGQRTTPIAQLFLAGSGRCAEHPLRDPAPGRDCRCFRATMAPSPLSHISSNAVVNRPFVGKGDPTRPNSVHHRT